MTKEYTASDKRAMVAALKVAKTKLWNGIDKANLHDFHHKVKHTNICACLPTSRGGNKASDVIMMRLCPSAFVYSWLQDRAEIKAEDLTNQNVQAFRLRWINELIREFSE